VQRALLNAALRVRNAVVKLVDGRAVASLSLRSLTLDSADGRWDRCFVELEGASRTLRKVLELSDLTLCLDALGAGSSRVKRFERPLLRAPLLTLRAEAPMLPGARTDGSPTLRLDALSHRLDVSVSEAQLGLLDGLVQAVQAAIEEATRAAVGVRTERSQQRSHRAATDTTAPNAADTMAAASVGPARSAATAAEEACGEQHVGNCLLACASASSVPTGSQGVPTGSQGVSQGHTAAATAAAPVVVEGAREGAEQHSQPHSQQHSPPRSPPRSRLGRAAGWAYSMFFEDDEDEGEPEGPAAASHGGGSQGPAAASGGSRGVGSMTGAAAASGEASDEEVDLAARSSIWDLELSAQHVCVMARLSSASLTLLSAPPDATAHDSARPIAALLLLGAQLEGHCVEDEPGARCGAQCARDDAPCARDDAPAADLSFVVRVASLSIWRSLDDSSHDCAKGLASGPLLTMLSHAGGAPPQVG